MKQFAITRLLLALGLILLSYAPLSYAAQWYQVEMLLVAYTDLGDIEQEHWPIELDNAPIFNHTQSINWLSPLNSQATNRKVIRRFGAPNSKRKTTGQLFNALKQPSLLSYAHKINKTPNMRVIWHQSWLEPIQSKTKASAHRINLNLAGSPVIKLTGEIKLYRSRYLHIRTNLHLRHYVKGLQQTNSTAAPNKYRTLVPMRAAHIQLARRMRSNELHYLDHPMLGVVIKATPVSKM